MYYCALSLGNNPNPSQKIPNTSESISTPPKNLNFYRKNLNRPEKLPSPKIA